MWTTIKKLFWVSRPVSWPNTAYPFAAGYVLSGGGIDAVFIIGTIYFLVFYNLLMYGVNDVFDYESDIRNPRKGGIEGMREERRFHPIIIKACIVTNIPLLAYLAITSAAMAGGIGVLTLTFVIFMVLAYSIKGLRFKEVPVLDSITSSIHFVGPLVFALILTGGIGGAWPYVAAFFLWGMASHAFGAVQDIIPDRAGGLKSIATALGAARTVRLAMVLYLAAAALVCAQGGAAIIVGISGLAYVFNIVQYWNSSDAGSAGTNRAWQRFIWLNYFVGFVVTMVLIGQALTQ